MTEARLTQGSAAWFDMVGRLMIQAASGCSPDLTLSLVERYSDGVAMSPGLVQGFRFDVRAGRPWFRVGAGRDEKADIAIEITAAAARRLNLLRSEDPAYRTALEQCLRTGEMRIEGDPSLFGDWLAAVHDAIVDRTV